MYIEHASDTIKSETIKVILVHPETQVAEQEAHNLVVAVVEQSAVPLVMATFASTMEVLVIGSVKLVQAVQNILGGVAMNDIEQYSNSQAVSGVNQLLEVLGGSISTAGSEEVVNLITKTGVVGMLHNRHQLDNIVAQIFDTGQHVSGELLVGGHTLFGGGDTDMGLVHSSTARLGWSGVLELVSLFSRRVPESSIVCGRDVQILSYVFDPRRETVNTFTRRQTKGDLIQLA